MRDRETIDSELRRIAAQRRSIRERGGRPPSGQVDALLDERLGHRAGPTETDVVETDDVTPRRRKSALRRFGPRMALPLSLLAVVVAAVAVLVMTFAVHHPDSAAQPTAI